MPRDKSTTQNAVTYLDKEDYRALVKLAKRKDLSLAEYIRKAIAEYASKDGLAIKEVQHGGNRYVTPTQVDDPDDAAWDASFANSQDFLEKLAAEGEALYRAGLTEDFDPDTDPDLQ
jgi:hypothetical protein